MAELAAAVLKLAEAVVDHVPAQALALGHKGCCAHTIPMNKCVAKKKEMMKKEANRLVHGKKTSLKQSLGLQR